MPKVPLKVINQDRMVFNQDGMVSINSDFDKILQTPFFKRMPTALKIS